MKITFIGTGACIVNVNRGFPSLLVDIGDEQLLFDCGSGTISKLASLGVKVSELSYLFITHFHPDHVSDYVAMVHDRALSTRKVLKVYGPKGLMAFSDILFNHLYPGLGVHDGCFEFLRVKEVVEGLAVKQSGWKVFSAPVKHEGAISYKIECEGKSILYSGDTSPCEALVKLGAGVDLAILECSYPSEESLKGEHLCPKYAGALAAEMGAKKLALTHLYPDCYGKERLMLQEVRRHFNGEAIIAQDLMEIYI